MALVMCNKFLIYVPSEENWKLYNFSQMGLGLRLSRGYVMLNLKSL